MANGDDPAAPMASGSRGETGNVNELVASLGVPGDDGATAAAAPMSNDANGVCGEASGEIDSSRKIACSALVVGAEGSKVNREVGFNGKGDSSAISEIKCKHEFSRGPRHEGQTDGGAHLFFEKRPFEFIWHQLKKIRSR